MKYFHKKNIFPYKLKNIFDLVMDIESYPEFLPWISSATIIKEEPGKIVADLIVNFAGFKQSYRSNVIHAFQENGESCIEAESHTGPFKHLKSKWVFFKTTNNNPGAELISTATAMPDATSVDFFLEFELKSKLMTNIVSSVIINTQEQMIAAFANRAREKYGKKS